MTRRELEERAMRARKLKEELEKRLAERSLYEFIKQFWHIIEPGRSFVGGWHIEALCEHLEAVTRGEVKRLLVNVPPGFMKSLTLNVFWPAWEWGPQNMPTMRYLCASYAETLTIRDNEKFRLIVNSELYQKRWGDRVIMNSYQSSKTKVGNEATGWKMATSISGVGTGERGDRVLIDDPNSVKEAESQAVRQSTLQWFSEVIPTRINSPKESVIIVIQQRTHEEDVSGYILSKDMNYTHLCIPMKFDPDRRCVTSIGWVDPRTEDGELAWPEQYSGDYVARLERELGPYAAAGQLQQAPSPRGGGIIKREWWGAWEDIAPPGRENTYPRFSYVVATLDPAYTEKQENDYSGFNIWGVFHEEERHAGYNVSVSKPRVMLIMAWQDRLALHDLVKRVDADCRRFKVNDLLIEAKASGLSVEQELRRLFVDSPYGIRMDNPKGDKVSRVHAISHFFYDGLVYAPNKRWAEAVIDQMSTFPKGKHDDLVDAVSMALSYLRKSGVLVRKEEAYSAIEDEVRRPVRRGALYPC